MREDRNGSIFHVGAWRVTGNRRALGELSAFGCSSNVNARSGADLEIVAKPLAMRTHLRRSRERDLAVLRVLLIAALAHTTLLAACSEWRTFPLKNSTTGAVAVCAIHWGQLSDEDTQRVRQCVEACKAHGFSPQSPSEIPPAVTPVLNAKPPSIPLACQG
jgi:predicted RNA-binding Zn ribbon-like protein